MNRKLRLPAALAIVAVIIAGCSNVSAGTDSRDANTNAATSPAGTGGDNTATPTAHEQAVKFAECMRNNGVGEFPDPNASGGFTIDEIANGSGVDTNSAAFKQAMSACKNLQPPGFTGNERSPEQQAAGIKFAQCIRDYGVKDFPDPLPDGPLVDTNRIPSTGRSGGMSALRAAMQKCRALAAAAGVTGGR